MQYVFPDKKLFPIHTPVDIKKAVEAYKIFEDEIPYNIFVGRLINTARSLGKDYINALPTKMKKMAGIKKDNSPESQDLTLNIHKKKPSRFIRSEEYED